MILCKLGRSKSLKLSDKESKIKFKQNVWLAISLELRLCMILLIISKKQSKELTICAKLRTTKSLRWITVLQRNRLRM